MSYDILYIFGKLRMSPFRITNHFLDQRSLEVVRGHSRSNVHFHARIKLWISMESLGVVDARYVNTWEERRKKEEEQRRKKNKEAAGRRMKKE